MIFRETKLKGAIIIEPETFADERGFFARTWSLREFAERGLESQIVECNTSFNQRKGTLRGMHYQVEPYSQVKIVRCPKGAIFDVLVDLRPTSPTFRRWAGVELNERNGLMLYVPTEFAHGFQTLEDQTEVFYQMFEVYAPQYSRGLRWDDPSLGINWPLPVTVISEQDRSFELLAEDVRIA